MNLAWLVGKWRFREPRGKGDDGRGEVIAMTDYIISGPSLGLRISFAGGSVMEISPLSGSLVSFAIELDTLAPALSATSLARAALFLRNLCSAYAKLADRGEGRSRVW